MTGFDLKAAEAHLAAWFQRCPPGEMAYLKPLRKSDPGRATRAHFTADMGEALSFFEEAHAAGDDLYLGCLPRFEPTPKPEGVRSYRWLWADVDIGSEGHAYPGMHATEEDAICALDAVPARPTVLIHSGGGLQAWWELEDELFPDRWQDAMLRIALAVGGDASVCHPSTILRLAGTQNHKIEGRPRPVRLLDVSGHSIGFEQLVQLPPLPPSEEPPEEAMPAARPARTTFGSSVDRPFDRANDVPVLQVARALGVRFRKFGGRWFGPCPVHRGECPTSMLYGGRSNVATCFSDCNRKAYTAVDLVAGTLAIEPRAAVAWLADKFGFEGFRYKEPRPAPTPTTPATPPAPVVEAPAPEPPPADEEDDEEEGPAGGDTPEAPAAPPPAPPPAPPATGGGGGDDDDGGGKDDLWIMERLQCAKKTGPKANLANAALILSNAQGWRGALRYNEFAEKIICHRAPPSHAHLPGDTFPRQWNDRDDLLAQLWVQQKWCIDVAQLTSRAAVITTAMERRFHPVRAYLRGLVWDGQKRSEEWLVKYLGAADNPYTRAVGAMFLRSAAARILRPGCKVDTMPVLQGKQGFLKSTALKILFNPWFTDELADFGSKDAAQQLRGVWGIEVGELSAMRRSEIERVKAFLTRTTDRYRSAYAEHVLEHPRQCILAATTNAETFLPDTTGNRRFWPIRCGVTLDRADLDGLAGARDQLWAEALVEVEAGVPWWLNASDKEAVAGALEAQEGARERDAWESKILDHVEKCVTSWFSPGDLLAIVGIDDSGKWTENDQRRVVSIVRGLGWTRRRKGGRGVQTWGWSPPGRGEEEGGAT